MLSLLDPGKAIPTMSGVAENSLKTCWKFHLLPKLLPPPTHSQAQLRLSNPLLLSRELAREFFKEAGTLLVDKDKKDVKIYQGIARGKVCIKSSQTICPLKAIQTSTGVVVAASYHYEKIKNMCFQCGRLDHSFFECTYPNITKGLMTQSKEFVENESLWGPFSLINEWSPHKSTFLAPSRQESVFHPNPHKSGFRKWEPAFSLANLSIIPKETVREKGIISRELVIQEKKNKKRRFSTNLNTSYGENPNSEGSSSSADGSDFSDQILHDRIIHSL